MHSREIDPGREIYRIPNMDAIEVPLMIKLGWLKFSSLIGNCLERERDTQSGDFKRGEMREAGGNGLIAMGCTLLGTLMYH